MHRTARPVAALRRELLLQNLVFKVGALDWPGSRGCQRTTGVSRMRPLVRSRPTRASPNYEREPGDVPLSLNAFSVDSTLVWDALPERIRDFLGMTRMTLQLREVWAPVGFAKLQQLLSELQAESRGLGVCSATRDRLAATHEHLAAVLRQSSDTFLVVSFPLLGRHGARLGVRPQKEMVHIWCRWATQCCPRRRSRPRPRRCFSRRRPGPSRTRSHGPSLSCPTPTWPTGSGATSRGRRAPSVTRCCGRS